MMETIVPPGSAEYPEAEQDLNKIKRLRSNVVVMEQEQRKLQEAWNGNSKEKNKKLNMDEQVDMARMCVVNARNTLSDYKKYMRDEKYLAWNRDREKKNCLDFSQKKVLSTSRENLHLESENSLKNVRKCDIVNKQPEKTEKTVISERKDLFSVLKSNVDQVNTALLPACQIKKMFKRKDRKDSVGNLKKSKHEIFGKGNFNRKRGRRRPSVQTKLEKIASEVKLAKKQHLKQTAGLQKLPHLVCQFNNYSQSKPNLSCPVGKIYKTCQELLAHVFFVHRGEIFNQTTKTKKLLLACPYNDPVADIKCGDSFHAFSNYEYNHNFELQLSVALFKLQQHISACHLVSLPDQQCSVCGQEVLARVGEVEARHYWQHLATHLQEYQQLLPPGVISGAPVISNLQFQLPCNMGCALSFKSSHDFITHVIQEHWQAVMTSVSSSQSIHWTCPANGSCGFSISKPVLKEILVEVGEALSLLSSHIRQYHCAEMPADQCPTCLVPLQYLPDHLAWQHIAEHASIDLVWCGPCGRYCSRGEVSDHYNRWCKVGDLNRAEFTNLEQERRVEETENIRDRKECMKKINKVAEESANEWMQEDLKKKVINHIEMKDAHEHLEKMIANYEIRRSDVGTITTLMKITEQQQTRALKKLPSGKKRKRVERALASFKTAASESLANLQLSEVTTNLNNGFAVESLKNEGKPKGNRKKMKRKKQRKLNAEKTNVIALDICDKLEPELSSTEICSGLLCEIYYNAVSLGRAPEDYDISNDEIEFVKKISCVTKKRPSAWDLLSPTPKLDKPRPPARYCGVGEFLSQLMSGMSGKHRDMEKVRHTSSETFWETIESEKFRRIPDQKSSSSKFCKGKLPTSEVTIGKTLCEEPDEEFSRVSKTVTDVPDLEHQPHSSAVPKLKYTCPICGTQFSKKHVLHFHMTVHR